jgi:hypothetical protein
MSDRVLLTTLSIRTSKGGRRYYVGYLAKARLLGFPTAELDKFGNEQIELYVVEPEPRDGSQRPAPRQQTASSPPSPPGGLGRLYQRESRASRRDRAERDAIQRYGGAVLDDEIPM